MQSEEEMMSDKHTVAGWFIEAAGHKWWDGTALDVTAFTTDPNAAVLFARESDANLVLYRILNKLAPLLKATPHLMLLQVRGDQPTEEREKAKREVERRHDIADCKAAWDRLRTVIHAANCRCHSGRVRQCDEVRALQIDQDYPHLHPYVDPKCAALRGGDRE